MKRASLLTILFLQMVNAAQALTIWNLSHLAEVKSQSSLPAYVAAISQLQQKADDCMQHDPASVMQKDQLPASGNRHDYLSLSRYFWPDPTKPDGRPYINRDGVSNPELERLDRNRLGTMAADVVTLSLAWYFTDDERYAQKAVQQLRTWFLDKATRMNPHLEYAQIVPGQNNDRGRCYGLIDSYSFVEMLDAVQLLQQSSALTARDAKALRQWFGTFLSWMLNSPQGQEENRQQNNHAVAYDVQVMSYAAFTGDTTLLRLRIHQFFAQRLPAQIADDGSQPHELWRTLSFGYSQYNLSHIIDVLQIARHAHIAIADSSLHRVQLAADYLAQYLGRPVTDWPHQQISQWEQKQAELAKDIYRLASPSQGGERKAEEYLVKNFSDCFFLLYYTPDETDHAFAQADRQLRLLMKNTQELRRSEQDKSRLMPRCAERDGRLRLVGIHDWCSGFFPGMLWQMYRYSHDPFWRQQAASATWLLDDLKYDGGTHDLGFMVYSSFGLAWQLTGERSYRDVVLQAARTLATRFNPSVGCIRSWSWGTPERWQYAVIIDNMMNLEMLFEAARLSGDQRFHNIAVSHADQTLKNHFRADGSSYHVVDYNPQDGSVLKRITFQGLFDESVWSRGQGWGLYGFTMCYRYTHDPHYLEQARRIARFWLSQPQMPEDHIPYWDMRDPAIETGQGPALDGGCPRDASAAAVIASALYELATYVTDTEATDYRRAADDMITSLTDSYQPAPGTSPGFLLLHSTGNYPAHDEIDVSIIYADYYYLEALLRRSALKSNSQK